MKKFWFIPLLCLSGCLSVIRVPIPLTQYDDEGEVVQRVWTSFFDGENHKYRVYPTLKMRWEVTKAVYGPAPEDLKGEELARRRQMQYVAWLPLSIVWITAPVDAVVDTCFLYADLTAEPRPVQVLHYKTIKKEEP